MSLYAIRGVMWKGSLKDKDILFHFKSRSTVLEIKDGDIILDTVDIESKDAEKVLSKYEVAYLESHHLPKVTAKTLTEGTSLKLVS
jgi:hypothetical protein